MRGFILSLLFLSLSLLVDSHWIKEMENPDLFEGDIILDPDERHANGSIKFSAIIGHRWPNPVPYEFHRDMKRQRRGVRVIKEAMAQYEKYTCIRFKERTTEKGYMRFDWAPGCASSVGFKPGKINKINLDAPCWNLGTVMHEMGHSLGLWHEQSRPDRDDYIEIVWENIKEQHKHNFNKHEKVESFTPYDLSSMMHYGTAAFTKNGQRTIKPLDYSKRLLIGQRAGFSNLDVKELNAMYKCPAYRGTVPPKICKDTGEVNCPHWKQLGRCRDASYETTMYRECCMTCWGHVAGKLGEPKTWPPGERVTKGPIETAKPTQPGTCVDKKDKRTCDYWARLGYCTTSSQTLRKFTQANCCATCRDHHK